MALTKTFPTDRPAGLPVADTRLINAGLVECNMAGVPRVGILPAHYNPLVTGTAGMAYQVAAFNAVTSRSGSGVEYVANDGAATVATTAAPGANSRIDVIWVRSLFTTYADGSSDPVFGVTQGVASASPSKPAIPAGALELATAVVLSTTTQTSTAVITQTHTYTAMEGGIVALRSQAEQDAWSPADGSTAYRIDSKITYKRLNGVWMPWDSDWLTASAGISASSGAINDGTASHRYKYASGAIIDTITINIINAGTGSGALNVGMPFTVAGTWMGTGRSEIDGSQLQVRVQVANATVFKYNNATAIAVGTMYLTVVCGLT